MLFTAALERLRLGEGCPVQAALQAKMGDSVRLRREAGLAISSK